MVDPVVLQLVCYVRKKTKAVDGGSCVVYPRPRFKKVKAVVEGKLCMLVYLVDSWRTMVLRPR